jgi:hypothetical protein
MPAVLIAKDVIAAIPLNAGVLPRNLWMGEHQAAIFVPSHAEGERINRENALHSAGMEDEMGSRSWFRIHRQFGEDTLE